MMSSVADPGCLSRIPDPGSWFLPIPDPGSQISDPGSKNSNKRDGWKKFVIIPFLWPQISQHCKLVHFFNVEEKNLANFKKIIELFTQKIVTKLSKIWVRDPGSEIRDPEKTYSGSRIQGSIRHRIPDPDPQHWWWGWLFKSWTGGLIWITTTHCCDEPWAMGRLGLSVVFKLTVSSGYFCLSPQLGLEPALHT